MTGGVRGLLRRLLAPRRLVLQPIQADFVRIASARFDFVVRDWGYVAEVTGDEMFELNVLFRGPRVAVEITFSEQTWILTKALPLWGGRLPVGSWRRKAALPLYAQFIQRLLNWKGRVHQATGVRVQDRDLISRLSKIGPK